jgi:hypothetical protein
LVNGFGAPGPDAPSPFNTGPLYPGDRFMYGVGQADSWRERKVEVSLRRKMLNVFMKGYFSFLGICQCQV